ncbi:MAG: SGNH/GDSL hydrolase family protein [Paenibacillaceae bacterium]|nr:SGNH/GDSL hydrolase family protein [Paenibacillaceae bacterium]
MQLIMQGIGMDFLRVYTLNITAAAFPVLTENRRSKKTIDREFLMLGDSHGWGQGSPDYDGQCWYSPHMTFPYNKGFYARIQSYIQQKLGLHPAPLVPLSAKEVQCISGVVRHAEVPFFEPEAEGFYYPLKISEDGQANARFGYLIEDHKFGLGLSVFTPLEGDKAWDGIGECHVDATHPFRKLYVGVLAGPSGAKLEIDLRTPPYYVRPPGYPNVRRIAGEANADRSPAEAEVTGEGNIFIDTYTPEGYQDRIYAIDYGQKQSGKLCLRYAGANSAADTTAASALVEGCSATFTPLMIRGILVDGNRMRNISMGGHTVGQWWGDGTTSCHDRSSPHIDDILAYTPFTPTLALIQLPVVNEYLAQTPIAAFKKNLDIVIRKLNKHRNPTGSKKMDVLLFTTLADRAIQFQGKNSLPVSYGHYFAASRQYCVDRGYGFVDFQLYFQDAVEQGGLDYELLYDDATHPSPFANEKIASGLISVLDMLM